MPAFAQSESTVLLAIDFVDSLTGWIAGDNGFVMRTLDGGITWQEQTTQTTEIFWGIDFLDSFVGWGAGGVYQTGAVIVRTEDGGNNWQVSFIDSLTTDYKAIMFLDEKYGWTAGLNGAIAHTNDGGQTWQRQESGISADLDYITFVDTLHGWAVGEESWLLRTEDGGKAWIAHESVGGSRKVLFFDSLVGYLLALTFADLLKTTDGGQSWFLARSGGGSDFGDDLFFVDSLRGWMVLDGGVVRTRDGGATWEGFIDGPGLSRVFFLNDGVTGWGLRSFEFWHTRNGGETWTLGPITSVDNKGREHSLPTGFILHQNYPNPFNPETRIHFEILETKTKIDLTIFDLLGQKVITLIEGEVSKGQYSLRWDGRDQQGKNVASAIYVYQLKSGSQVQTKKMVLLR